MAKTIGPSDTDAGARKPRPVKPRAVKPAQPKAAQPAPRKPKAVPQKPVKPAQPAPQKPKAVEPAQPKAVPPKAVPPKAVASTPVARKDIPPKAVPAKPAAAKAAAPRAAKPTAAQPGPVTPRKARSQPSKAKAQGKARAPAAAPPAAAARPSRKEQLPQDDPLIGRTIGRCRIEELVGVGKTAKVYRAHYEALDDDVAIKILRKDIARNPVLVDRFQSEARAIAKVDNENVLKIYDVSKEDGLYYMVVEFLDGEEVFEVIRREGQVEPCVCSAGRASTERPIDGE